MNFGYRYFCFCPEDVRLERRIVRDVAERGRSAEQAEAQFSKTVQPMHNEFVEPSKTNADMILSGESDFSDACLDIERRLHSYLKRSS